MGSQLANQVDWVSLSRKVSRQCRDVLGVRLAAEELCRLLSEEGGLLGGRLHLTSEFETIVLQHGPFGPHALAGLVLPARVGEQRGDAASDAELDVLGVAIDRAQIGRAHV